MGSRGAEAVFRGRRAVSASCVGVFGGCRGAGGDLAVGEEGETEFVEKGQFAGGVWQFELDSACGRCPLSCHILAPWLPA